MKLECVVRLELAVKELSSRLFDTCVVVGPVSTLSEGNVINIELFDNFTTSRALSVLNSNLLSKVNER